MLRSIFIAVGVCALVGCMDDEADMHEDHESVELSDIQSAGTRNDLARLALATAKYHDLSRAQADGHALLPGLDHCFNNPPTGAMGYHYINAAKLDLVVENMKPEAMVYYTNSRGQLQFGAVEYIVPGAAWDAANPGKLPRALGRNMHFNTSLGVYVMHVWLWKENPTGIFQDWNPRVSCP